MEWARIFRLKEESQSCAERTLRKLRGLRVFVVKCLILLLIQPKSKSSTVNLTVTCSADILGGTGSKIRGTGNNCPPEKAHHCQRPRCDCRHFPGERDLCIRVRGSFAIVDAMAPCRLYSNCGWAGVDDCHRYGSDHGQSACRDRRSAHLSRVHGRSDGQGRRRVERFET